MDKRSTVALFGAVLLSACSNRRSDQDAVNATKRPLPGFEQCGDGVVGGGSGGGAAFDSDEECDDGNTQDWDGCSASCTLEYNCEVQQDLEAPGIDDAVDGSPYEQLY